MATYSSFEKHYRYLSAPGSERGLGHFGRFLEKYGVELPDDPGLRELTALGWIRPMLRVRLPESFLLNWKEFPLLANFDQTLESDRWAQSLWVWGSTNGPVTKVRGHQLGSWYTHFLDRPGDTLASRAREAELRTGPGVAEPPPILHTRGCRRFFPWLDYFAHWQAYEIFEVLQSAYLFPMQLNTPDACRIARERVAAIAGFQEDAERRLLGTKQWFEEMRPAFEAVSRYRVLIGAWVEDGRWDRELLRQGARQMASEMNWSLELLRDGVKSLLRLWQSWEPREPLDSYAPFALRALLREDIDRLVAFTQIIAGRSIESDDSFWGTESRLSAALPFESDSARSTFPSRASGYLQFLESLVEPKFSFDEDRIEKVVRRHWSTNVQLRRYILAFHRLHEHLKYSPGDRVGLRADTPVEFLGTCALRAEKLLLAASGREGQAPGFYDLLKLSFAQSLRLLELDPGPAIEALAGSRNEMNLKKLISSSPSPFKNADSFLGPEEPPLIRELLACYFNFAVLRNYTAHHDCLDDQLVYTNMAERALVSTLVVVILALSSKR